MRALGKKRISGVTDDQIVSVYSECKSAYLASKTLGVAISTVYRVLHKRGIERIGLGEYRRRLTRFQGQEEKIREMYEAGCTHSELKTVFGDCSDYALKHAIARAGGTLRQNPVPTIKPGELESILAMRAAGKSQQSIAVALGRSQGFVGRWLRDSGVEQPIRSGENHSRWKGGRMVIAGGYVRVQVQQNDPMASMRNNTGYVLEHRLTLARHLGRPLRPSETVHHIDGNPSNNAIENLQLRQGKHGNGSVMCCLDCGSHNIGPSKLKG